MRALVYTSVIVKYKFNLTLNCSLHFCRFTHRKVFLFRLQFKKVLQERGLLVISSIRVRRVRATSFGRDNSFPAQLVNTRENASFFLCLFFYPFLVSKDPFPFMPLRVSREPPSKGSPLRNYFLDKKAPGNGEMLRNNNLTPVPVSSVFSSWGVT